MPVRRFQHGVRQGRREARLMKMVAGAIKAEAGEALGALNTDISRVFALYMAGRQGRRLQHAKAICNKFLKFNGRDLTLADCIRFTDTHPVLKECDPVTTAAAEMVGLMERSKYPFAERVAVVGLALVSRSRQFVQALQTEVRKLPLHHKRPAGRVSAIIGMPELVAQRLGILEAAAVVPERRLPTGGRKVPNCDAASWNVGRAAGDLVNMAVLSRSLFGDSQAQRQVTYERIVKLVSRTSCRRLIVNHFVQTFRALGWFTAETDETKIQSSTNANDFVRLLASPWSCFSRVIQLGAQLEAEIPNTHYRHGDSP